MASVCDDTSSELQRVATLDPRGGNSRNSFQRSGAISRYSYDKPTAQHQSQPMTASVSADDMIRKCISDVPDLMRSRETDFLSYLVEETQKVLHRV